MILFNKKKTCILIDPGVNYLQPFDGLHVVGHFPFGILSMATFLEKNGYSVNVIAMDHIFKNIDEPLSRDEVLKRIQQLLNTEIKRCAPLLLGVSISYTVQCTLGFEIINFAKSLFPQLVTAAGGSHVTFLDERSLKECAGLDIVIRGEGEWTIASLMHALKNKLDLQQVNGITFKKDNKIIRTKERFLGDLSQLPILNFNLLSSSFYKGRNINIAPSRGCYYTCQFCTDRIFWKNQLRITPVEKLIAEAQILFKKFNIGFLSFEDSMIDVNGEFFSKMANEFQKIPNRRLGVLVARIDGITEEALGTISKAGFTIIIYGLESASEKVLLAMNKKNDMNQMKKIFSLTKKNNIEVGCFWIVGHPGDNIDESQKTISMMQSLYKEEILDRSRISRFLPYPGTDYFTNPQKYGIEILHFNWEYWRRHTKDGVCQLTNYSNEQIGNTYEKLVQISIENEFINSLQGQNFY